MVPVEVLSFLISVTFTQPNHGNRLFSIYFNAFSSLRALLLFAVRSSICYRGGVQAVPCGVSLSLSLSLSKICHVPTCFTKKKKMLFVHAYLFVVDECCLLSHGQHAYSYYAAECASAPVNCTSKGPSPCFVAGISLQKIRVFDMSALKKSPRDRGMPPPT